jgi:hypothetical protein
MNDRLSALKLFARAARVGNFSSAGRELGWSQPSASRLIAALEKEVGATLFSRTTRAVTLTEAGETYLMRVEAILAALDDERSTPTMPSVSGPRLSCRFSAAFGESPMSLPAGEDASHGRPTHSQRAFYRSSRLASRRQVQRLVSIDRSNLTENSPWSFIKFATSSPSRPHSTSPAQPSSAMSRSPP